MVDTCFQNLLVRPKVAELGSWVVFCRLSERESPLSTQGQPRTHGSLGATGHSPLCIAVNLPLHALPVAAGCTPAIDERCQLPQGVDPVHLLGDEMEGRSAVPPAPVFWWAPEHTDDFGI